MACPGGKDCQVFVLCIVVFFLELEKEIEKGKAAVAEMVSSFVHYPLSLKYLLSDIKTGF